MTAGDNSTADLGQRLRCESCGASFIVTHAGHRPECCGQPLAGASDTQPQGQGEG